MSVTIAEWLDQFGFGKYLAAFTENDVGLDVLDLLTKDDLEKIGVSLGDRLRMMREITARSSGSGVPALPPPIGKVGSPRAVSPTTEAPPLSGTAERRPLTVMFCDLADSTALSAKLDPEDLQDVIRAYQDASADCVRRYEGYVAKYMGDGILVYFGYPQALERNAERAIHSALEIVEAMAGLNRTLGQDKGVEIAVRIGIATGTVMVGEVVGEGMAQERTVIGEAPNTAARLQTLAGRNGIVIGPVTKEVSGDAFLYEDQGAHVLKGIADPVQTWGVLGLRDEGRSKTGPDDHGGVIRPVLVGRDEEIGLLRRAWQSTKSEGRGLVLTLNGEAGIGKSSLIDGLKDEVSADGWPLLTMRCSPFHTNSALYPVIEHFKRLARWAAGDDALMRLEKIERMLDRYAQPNAEAVPLMAALLSVPVPEDHYPPLDLSPQQQKQQTQDMIVGITMEVAERGAFLELWEDLHWADPSTLEMIGLLIEQAPTAGLLMVLTARPEFSPPWPMRSHVTPITLNRLERPHAAALVTRIAGAKPLPIEVLDHIVSKTDGVPLYLEELTKTILASDILRDTGAKYELTGPLESLAIPDTLQESLMARLDRLPQVRELAQLGSVLGREFAYEMISGLTSLDDKVLQSGLAQLVEDEMLYQRGRPPRAKYIFKHALVQDAAYASLLRRTRQQTHQSVAELLEGGFPDLVQNQPELLAHHYGEAGDPSRAADYLKQAGGRSLLRSANPEAIAHLTNGLALIGMVDESPERSERELGLLLMLAPALVAAKGYAAPEVEPAYMRSLELCETLGNSEKQFTVLLGLSMFHFIRANIQQALDLAEKAAALARAHPRTGFDLAAARQLGLVICYRGDFVASRQHHEHVAENYDPDTHGSFAFQRGGSDFGVSSIAILGGFSLFPLGFADQARDRCAEALAIAERIDHPLSLAFAHWGYTRIYAMRGDHQAFRQHAAIVEAIADEKGFPQYISWVAGQRGEVLLRERALPEAIAELTRGIETNRALGGRLFDCGLTASLAEAYALSGQRHKAFDLIDEALAHIDQSQERYDASKAYLVKGRLLLMGENANAPDAETCFRKAIEIAQSQSAKMWELRATISLARLWQEQGKIDSARSLLAAIHVWFTEGFDTSDLESAKELQDELG